MKVYTRLEDFKPQSNKPLILGIGNFDGIHLGHQALITHVENQAEQLSGEACLLTFQEHPQTILHPETKPPILMSPEHKLVSFQEAGIETCFWIPFTESFSKITADSFIQDLLVKQLNVREVCMGYNAHFGYGREGDVSFMRRRAQEFGFKFEEIAPVQMAGDYVSSSRIRELVTEGSLSLADECLGKPFRILGEVEPGDGRGRELGFPTANIRFKNEVMPPAGVYPARLRRLAYEFPATGTPRELKVKKRGEWMQAIVNYGLRPTFKDDADTQAPVLEVHLLDFDGDLYGQTVEVGLLAQIRAEKAFGGPDELRHQIDLDIREARKALSRDF